MSRRGNTIARGRRGQPVVVLLVLLLAWAGMRVATWHAPLGMRAQITAEAAGIGDPVDEVQAVRLPAQVEPGAALQPAEAPRDADDPANWHVPYVPAPSMREWNRPPPQVEQVSRADVPAMSPRAAAGHTMLLAAAFSRMEIPQHLLPYLTRPAGPPASPATSPDAAPFVTLPSAEQARQSRWSVDGWLLWREDTTTPVLSGRPSYGRSQAGAVVRYELAPGSGHRPQAHVRGSTALQGARDMEASAGLSARPLPQLPLRVAAEVRLGETAQGTRVRPAAYAVSEFPPLELPADTRGELYLQAGYVGGTYATAFVDGQARVDRSLHAMGDFDLRAGAGAWGGAQEDAARLDIGPSASVSFQLGEGRGRLAADYRIRVAGDAEPSSGPALTLSAGF